MRLAPALCACLLAGCTLDNQESLGHDLPDTGAEGVHAEPFDGGTPDVALDASDVVAEVGRSEEPTPDVTPPVAAGTCVAGTYLGTFQAPLQPFPSEVGNSVLGPFGVLIGPDGGAPSWSGWLSITLVNAGGALDGGNDASADLTISTGILTGIEPSGSVVVTALVGTLDCRRHSFNAELDGGTVAVLTTGSLDAGLALPLTGTLSATYDGTATPPSLTNGHVHLVVSPYFETAGGTWSATGM